MNLHYGCGLHAAEGWFNCDVSPTLRMQRLPLLGLLFRTLSRPVFPPDIHYGDIVKGIRIQPNSCEAIYCSHILEHLSLEDCRAALRNTHLYLKAGGLFRCVLPDFEQQVQTYIADANATAVTDFLSYTFLGRKTRPRTLPQMTREFLGNSHHLWMWDFKGLAAELGSAGFIDIRRCNFGDSANPAFKTVEILGRYDWGLAIECTK